MPYKDADVAKAKSRERYLKNRDKIIEQQSAYRKRASERMRAEKEAASVGPVLPLHRVCSQCTADIKQTYRKKWGALCPACVAAYQRQYRADNKARIAASKKQWVQTHSEQKAAQDRAYAQSNPERRRAARAKWDEKNPGATAAAKRTNKASRSKRVPTWLSEDDRWMVVQAYELAALRTKIFGFPWHVDHKIPLHGRRVSGLHVPTNLQVIPGIENLRKGVTYNEGTV